MKVQNINVKSDSPVNQLAGCIVKSFVESETDEVLLKAIGAASVNQAAKAIASASGIFATKAKKLNTTIGFDSTDIKGETKTILVFRLQVSQ